MEAVELKFRKLPVFSLYLEVRVETVFFGGRTSELYHTLGMSDSLPTNMLKRGYNEIM